APEFHDRRAEYVRLVCEEMIPAVARQHLATACDVFCEPGVFDIAETRTILTAAQRHGLRLKLHADELEGSGGAELAAALGALSADHLAAISDAGIRALAASDTVAVLLPATMEGGPRPYRSRRAPGSRHRRSRRGDPPRGPRGLRPARRRPTPRARRRAVSVSSRAAGRR